jgi:ATP-dependent protease ClpP protease subunit
VGGEWTDGMAMFDAVKNSYSPVTFLMYAHARSMSSIIPQAADLRIMMPHTCFMVHNGSYSTEGHYDAVLSEVDFYKKSESAMLDIYAEKCQYGEFFASKKSMTKIKCMNYIRKKIKEKNDWYMDADEALYYGFCDGILGQDYETLEDIRR